MFDWGNCKSSILVSHIYTVRVITLLVILQTVTETVCSPQSGQQIDAESNTLDIVIIRPCFLFDTAKYRDMQTVIIIRLCLFDTAEHMRYTTVQTGSIMILSEWSRMQEGGK